MSLPLRTRLTAWYVGLLALIVAALAAFVVDRLDAGLTSGVDRTLAATATQIARGGDVEESPVTAAQLLQGPRVLAHHGPLARRPLARAPVRGFTRRIGGEEYRVLAVPVSGHDAGGVSGGGRRLIVVAQSLDGVQGALDRVLMLVVLGGPVALLIAALGGWWLARKALRPVGRMASEAERIEIDRLDERIAVPAARDELARLAVTLNAMLDRLGRGVELRERLIADASHELRSPLAVMRAEIDVALDAGEPAREVLESAREEVDRLARIVEDLLTLARLDAGEMPREREPLALRALAREVADDLAPLGVAIAVSGEDVTAIGDGRQVRHALANLVDNAVKASPPGAAVGIEAWRRDGRAGLTVRDAGPGVPAAERERIFARFARLDEARGRGGSGLGLALARELVEAQGGTVTVGSESEFTIALAGAAAAAPPPAPQRG
jgi:two-component system OmpR family sensor kinase